MRLCDPAELCEPGIFALHRASKECRNPWILLVAGTQQGLWFRVAGRGFGIGKAALKAFWFGFGEALA